MDTKTFENLARTGVIDHVTLFRPSAEANWEIHVHGAGLPKDVKTVIELDGGGGKRSWADLNAAHAFIRKHGYQRSSIEIDEVLGNAS